jgi:hypothetical protein
MYGSCEPLGLPSPGQEPLERFLVGVVLLLAGEVADVAGALDVGRPAGPLFMTASSRRTGKSTASLVSTSPSQEPPLSTCSD